jgi:hypothetical protein
VQIEVAYESRYRGFKCVKGPKYIRQLNGISAISPLHDTYVDDSNEVKLLINKRKRHMRTNAYTKSRWAGHDGQQQYDDQVARPAIAGRVQPGRGHRLHRRAEQGEEGVQSSVRSQMLDHCGGRCPGRLPLACGYDLIPHPIAVQQETNKTNEKTDQDIFELMRALMHSFNQVVVNTQDLFETRRATNQCVFYNTRKLNVPNLNKHFAVINTTRCAMRHLICHAEQQPVEASQVLLPKRAVH